MRKPKKSLSQNFLNDKNIAKKIVNLLDITNENVIEIGPGYGSLTDNIILCNPKNLYLIEKDYEIYKYLKKKYKNFQNIYVINEDIIKYDFSSFKNLKLISNLPYNISTKIILKLLKLNKNISEMIFMIQKEVSKKFDYNQKPNKYNFFTKISAQYKIYFNVPSSVFYPKPKVESTIVKFKLNKKDIDWNKITYFSTKIFSNKRKKIINNIKLTNPIISNLIEKRVEELSVDEVLNIYNSF